MDPDVKATLDELRVGDSIELVAAGATVLGRLEAIDGDPPTSIRVGAGVERSFDLDDVEELSLASMEAIPPS